MGNWTESALGDLTQPGGDYYEAVAQNTWGHLAPQKNKTYKGKILISNSGYGNNGIQIIAMEWNNKLEDSPWLFDSINDFLWNNREYFHEENVYKADITMRNYKYWIKITDTFNLCKEKQ